MTGGGRKYPSRCWEAIDGVAISNWAHRVLSDAKLVPDRQKEKKDQGCRKKGLEHTEQGDYIRDCRRKAR